MNRAARSHPTTGRSNEDPHAGPHQNPSYRDSAVSRIEEAINLATTGKNNCRRSAKIVDAVQTYLGHRDIHSTLVYITVTQDLLQQANERFRAFGAHCLHVVEGVQP